MGFFDGLKKALHVVSHPKETIQKIGKAIVKAEKSVEKTVVKVVKTTKNITGWIGDHAKTIKTVVDITASVLDGVATATGFPELVPGIEALRLAGDRALIAADKAHQAIELVEKAAHVAEAIKQKKKVVEIMRGIAEVAEDVANISGREDLGVVAGHLRTGADVVEKAHAHAVVLQGHLKKVVAAGKEGDIVGVLKSSVEIGKDVSQGVKEGKEFKRIIQMRKDLVKKNKGELIKFAELKKLKVKTSMTKEDLIQLIIHNEDKKRVS